MSQNFDDEFFQQPGPDPADKNWTGWIFSGLLVVAVISLGGYWFLGRDNAPSNTVVTKGAIPLLKADPNPIKRLPDNAGGIKVPFQDKLVYERVEKGAVIKVKERLLPNPEEPIRAGERFRKLLAQAKAEEKEKEAAEKLLLPKKSELKDTSELSAPKKGRIAKLIEENQALKEKNAEGKSKQKPVIGTSTPVTKKETAAKKIVSPPVKKKQTERENPEAKSKVETASKSIQSKEKPVVKPKIEPKTKVDTKPKKEALKKTATPKTVKEAPKKVAVKKVTKIAAKSQTKPTTTVTGRYTVQIAAFRTEENAKRGWRQLAKKYSKILKGESFSLQKITLKKKGTYYRLRTGRYPTRQAAVTQCARLKAAGQSCITSRF